MALERWEDVASRWSTVSKMALSTMVVHIQPFCPLKSGKNLCLHSHRRVEMVQDYQGPFYGQVKLTWLTEAGGIAWFDHVAANKARSGLPLHWQFPSVPFRTITPHQTFHHLPSTLLLLVCIGRRSKGFFPYGARLQLRTPAVVRVSVSSQLAPDLYFYQQSLLLTASSITCFLFFYILVCTGIRSKTINLDGAQF